MKKQVFYILLLWLCLASGCDWFRRKNPEPQLPPETQTGANTFGCLVNGKIWLPEGFPGPLVGPNFEVVYDPNYKGGTLNVSVYRATSGDIESSMALAGYEISQIPVTYSLDSPTNDAKRMAVFSSNSCDYYDAPDLYRKGTLTITRLDLQQGIVSGRFEFVLAKQGCDTLKVTQGRFDKKL
jgi:hypothetical protein